MRSNNKLAIMNTIWSSSFILVIALAGACQADINDLKEKWEKVAEVGDDSVFRKPQIASDGADEAKQPIIPQGEVEPDAPVVTNTLLGWVSSQCEDTVEEMEAIAKQNAASNKLSVVNYLRYLHLYDKLKTVAKQPYPQLKWVHLKAKALGSIYKETLEVLGDYLEDQNSQLLKVEWAEPKSKQVSVSQKWVELYENIRYLATHAPIGSALAQRATEFLQASPTNSPDKMRSMRYELWRSAFSKFDAKKYRACFKCKYNPSFLRIKSSS